MRPEKTQISLPRLIRVFTVHMKKAWVLSYPLSAQRRLWSDWADAQAHLSLCWAHTHFVGFVMSRLTYKVQLASVTAVKLSHFTWKSVFGGMGPGMTHAMENGKRRQKLITASWFSFPQYTWPLSRCIQNLKTLALIVAENCMTEFFIGEKEKWTNKGNDKQQHADSL